jgi:hypothetical protein
MAATKFVPLSTKLIDEGEFIRELDSELAELQAAHMRFVKKYGGAAWKSTSKLIIELAIKCETVNEDSDDHAFSVRASMKATTPKRPASLSMAMSGETATGEPCLFVRAAGSDTSDPKQGKMFTRDGRLIDPVTGEAADDDE